MPSLSDPNFWSTASAKVGVVQNDGSLLYVLLDKKYKMMPLVRDKDITFLPSSAIAHQNCKRSSRITPASARASQSWGDLAARLEGGEKAGQDSGHAESEHDRESDGGEAEGVHDSTVEAERVGFNPTHRRRDERRPFAARLTRWRMSNPSSDCQSALLWRFACDMARSERTWRNR